MLIVALIVTIEAGVYVYSTGSTTIGSTGITTPSINSNLWFNGLGQNVSDTMNYPVQTANYVIFQSGGTIYAKNGATGQIDFSGTSAYTVIQSCLNGLASGGEVFITTGTYTLTSPLQINYNGTSIIGENNLNTELTFSGGNVIDIGNSSNVLDGCLISNLYLVGDTSCIYAYASLTTISNCYMGGSTWSNGIVTLLGTSSVHGAQNYITQNTFISAGGAGITCSAYTSDDIIANNIIADCLQGIYIYNSTGHLINDNHIYGSASNGIYLVDASVNSITNNEIETCGKDGIQIETDNIVTSKDNLITGNDIWGNSQAQSNTYSGIKMDSGNAGYVIYGTQISSNTISGAAQEYGIQESGYVDGSLISNNWLAGNIAPLVVVGATTIVTSTNFGLITANIGSQTNGTATTFTITHGLTSTPTFVSASFNTMAITGWTWTATSSTITITVTGSSLPASMTCYWQATYVVP
jgi:parallel beta-helix repeat protein